MYKVYSAFLVVCSLQLCGCNGLVYLQAERDLDYRLKDDAKFFIYLPDDLSVTEKNLRKILKEEMTHAKLVITEDLKVADLIVHFSVHRKIWFSYMDNGFLLDLPFAQQNMVYRYTPYPYPYELRGLEIKLFNAQKYREGRRETLWEGSLSVSQDTYLSRMRDCIDLLIDFLGKNHEGNISLDR